MTSQRPTPRRPPLPAGLRRFVARLPVHLYRIGLGPLFGRRLLLLIHTGRTSGLTRRTVIEVVESDRWLCRFMGYEVDGSEADYRRVGESIPFLRLEAVPGSF
ncbi:hypothetical protein GCM10010271_19490 [Streptomyces kurssanovii]|nr:hypothetical protein GCM10010271_19490 [Streptomyces kurssanovii]